ncbi:MAG: hypothetical protein Q4A00_07105 [Flavobacteriaceae bacterium]|nr:hypothetical protein [Flavobacteriaceae bacterium]
MKTIIAGLLLSATTMLSAQESFTGRDDIRGYVGLNIQDGGTGIAFGGDYGFGESISFGAQAGYLISSKLIGDTKAKFGDRIDIKARFNTHLGRVMNLSPQIDIYPGLDLSLKNFGAHIGARYFFQKGLGVYSEIAFPLARYNTEPKRYDYLNNQFTFQLGLAFDLN